MAIGEVLDLEADDGGLVPNGTTWEHGTPTNGPGIAFSGNNVWATNLDGNYSNDTDATLELPQLLLGDAANPTLSFRMSLTTFLSDGISLERFDPEVEDWTALAAGEPDYEGSDDLGNAAWTSYHYFDEYTLFTVPLSQFAGAAICLRFRLVSSWRGTDGGAYIDDIALYDESDDPDGDGLPGISDEFTVHGSDPFLADTDGDGVDDGSEVAVGDDPLNPAVYPGAPVITPGSLLDFEADDGGLATRRTLWEHGTPSNGPGSAFSGSNVWATNLDGNFFNNADEYLYLPRLDLAASADPTLSFRMSLSTFLSDGVRLEFYDAATSLWEGLDAGEPAYQNNDDVGDLSWNNFDYFYEYSLFTVPLANFAGQELRLRFRFVGSCCGTDGGAYIDDIALYDESDDPDGDGLPGITGEFTVHGTDPLLADTDGDGVDDGSEVAAGDDPLNPAVYPGAPVITPGSLLDFEADDGGLATRRTLWEHGTPSNGPGSAFSGSNVWATNLDGNFFNNADEYLYLPRLDLSSSSAPTLSFHMWLATFLRDGISLEYFDAVTGLWEELGAGTPAYQNDPPGTAPLSWNNFNNSADYTLFEVPLSNFSGQELRVRFRFVSSCCGTDDGAYIDDIELQD